MNMASRPVSRLTPAVTLGLIRAADELRARNSSPAPRETERVKFFPSPNGIVRIVGTTLDGEWVAEHTCYEGDFTEKHVTAMERTVLLKESLRLVK